MKFFSILFLFAFNVVFAQQTAIKGLYYFISKDSLIGVKDRHGNIVIPAIHYNDVGIKENEKVKENLIYLNPVNKNAEPHSFGLVYNRHGEILYAPFLFDNGPDGIEEGVSRFVKNNKVGFVNRVGQIVIPAKFDFVDRFNYGIAKYCNGCIWKYRNEQSFVTGGVWGYINKKGEIIEPTNKKKNGKDQEIDSGQYLPYPFAYAEFEKKIIDSFNKIAIISKIHFVNYYSKLDSSERILHFEIIERPSDFYKYYHVRGFEFMKGYGYFGDGLSGDTDFYVTKDGKQYFGEYYGAKVPLAVWIQKKKKEASDYLKTHKDALYKF